MKYRVYGAIVGGVFLGEFNAASAEDAKDLARMSAKATPTFCHQCASKIEDAELDPDPSSLRAVKVTE